MIRPAIYFILFLVWGVGGCIIAITGAKGPIFALTGADPASAKRLLGPAFALVAFGWLTLWEAACQRRYKDRRFLAAQAAIRAACPLGAPAAEATRTLGDEYSLTHSAKGWSLGHGACQVETWLGPHVLLTLHVKDERIIYSKTEPLRPSTVEEVFEALRGTHHGAGAASPP